MNTIHSDAAASEFCADDSRQPGVTVIPGAHREMQLGKQLLTDERDMRADVDVSVFKHGDRVQVPTIHPTMVEVPHSRRFSHERSQELGSIKWKLCAYGK
jgi:hypothetical protein